MVCEIFSPKMLLYLRKKKIIKEPLIQIPPLFKSLVKNFDSSIYLSTLKSRIENNDIFKKRKRC